MASSRLPVYFNPAAATVHCSKPPSAPKVFHQSPPGYRFSPLVPLPGLAAELGVHAVFMKDESDRLGLGAFKILGASWGCYRAILLHLGLPLPSRPSIEDLKAKLSATSLTLVAATDGSHGRAVAFMAKLLGVKAQIHIPNWSNETTRKNITRDNAHLVVVDGDFDKAMDTALEALRTMDDGLLVQDTSFEGYEEIPLWIVQGYSTLMAEIDEQLSQAGLQCDLMVCPCGAGSIAQTGLQYCKSKSVPGAVMAAEADTAPGLYTSLNAGRMVDVKTSTTIMDGLNCGIVSMTAWPDLHQGLDACATVSCQEAHRAIQYLSPYVAAGPCGAATLAALWRLAGTEQSGRYLNQGTVVVLLNTEGPRSYRTPLDVTAEDSTSLGQTLTALSHGPSPEIDSVEESQLFDYLAAWFAHRGIEHHVEKIAGRSSIMAILRGSPEGEPSTFLDRPNNTVNEFMIGKGRQVVVGRGSSGLVEALEWLAATKGNGKPSRDNVIVAVVSNPEDVASLARHFWISRPSSIIAFDSSEI